jgi:hypothetical protein
MSNKSERSAALHVNWGRDEVAAVLAAVRACDIQRGRKNALWALEDAQRRLALKLNPKAHVSLRFGERPLELIGIVLQHADSTASRAARASLEKAALRSKRSARKAASPQTILHNPRSETRDQRIRHVSGRPRTR